MTIERCKTCHHAHWEGKECRNCKIEYEIFSRATDSIPLESTRYNTVCHQCGVEIWKNRIMEKNTCQDCKNTGKLEWDRFARQRGKQYLKVK